MEKREIIELLHNFGFNEYESRAYATLVMIGPAKALDICRSSEVPQSKIYNVLDILMKKQMVEVFEGRPKEFKAVSPEIALKSLIDEREDELRSLKTKASSISDVLKPLERTGEVLEGIWIQKGEKWNEFFDKISEMLARSNKYAYAITRDFSYSPALREAVKKCLKNKIDLKIMGMGRIDENNYLRAKWYGNLGLQVRVFETKVHPRILVVDGKEVLIRLDDDPIKKRFTFHSIWSQDPSLTKVFDSYMKNLWNLAKPVNFNKINFVLG